MTSEFIVVMRNSKSSSLRKWIALETTYSTRDKAEEVAAKHIADHGAAWEFRVAEIRLPDFHS